MLNLTIAWTQVHAIDALQSGLTRSDACATSTLLGPTIPVGPPSANPPVPRGAHLGVRVASCHASAPPAPHAGWPWLCHVASLPRCIHALVPRATSARRLGPLAMSAPASKHPPFCDFFNRKGLKNSFNNQIKIGKRLKLPKIIS